jgi:hypothetical protein
VHGGAQTAAVQGKKAAFSGPVDFESMPDTSEHEPTLDKNPNSGAWKHDNWLDWNPSNKEPQYETFEDVAAVKGRGAAMHVKGVVKAQNKGDRKAAAFTGPVDFESMPDTSEHEPTLDKNPNSGAWKHDNWLDWNPSNKEPQYETFEDVAAVKSRSQTGMLRQNQAELEKNARKVAETVRNIRKAMKEKQEELNQARQQLVRTEGVIQDALRDMSEPMVVEAESNNNAAVAQARSDGSKAAVTATKQAAVRDEVDATTAAAAPVKAASSISSIADEDRILAHSAAQQLARTTNTAWGWLNKNFYHGEKGVRSAEMKEAEHQQSLHGTHAQSSKHSVRERKGLTGRVGEAFGVGMCALMGVACS